MIVKTKKNHDKCNLIITKFIIVILLLIIIFFNLILPILYNLFINDENDNDWIKNKNKFLNYFLSNYNCKDLNYDLKRFKKYFLLKKILKDNNSSANLKVKQKLKHEFETKFKKNVSLLKNIFFKRPSNFGNQIAGLNNIIYYCEILGIKNIYFNSKYNWYIKNDINTDKIHISLMNSKEIDCNSNESLCGLVNRDFFIPIVVKAERRSLILKEEIKRNLPIIKTNKLDLYIYIRSGDSFRVNGNGYTPAPYCFYQKILNDFKFKNIIIISMDKKSPILRKLLSDYPYIEHKLQSKEKDLSSIIYAYNLVNSFSSFSQESISFNDNLINLFEYEVYKADSTILHFHYDVDKLNKTFTIYRMKPSEKYFNKMYKWRNTEEQREELFKDKCKYDFRKTKYNKTIFE